MLFLTRNFPSILVDCPGLAERFLVFGRPQIFTALAVSFVKDGQRLIESFIGA